MRYFAIPQRTIYLSKKQLLLEMYEYYKYWMERTFNGESFEVFDTLDGRGLGIRATKLFFNIGVTWICRNY